MIAESMYELGTYRSSIRELFEYGRRIAAEAGPDKVFDFSLGNPSVPPPAAVTETLLSLLREEEPCALHGYTSAPGAAETRQAIADDLNRRFGACLSAGDLYLTCGAAASLCIVLRALTASPGNRFLVQAPYFPEYKVFTESMGGRLTVVPPRAPDLGLNLSATEALLTPDTQGVILNSPNNPSGVIYDETSLRALAALLTAKAREYGHPLYLISDEPYREITYGKNVPFLPALYPDTVICYSYSKSLSLPGERIGYIAVPPSAADAGRLYAAVCGAGRALGYVCAPALWQKMLTRCAGLTTDVGPYRKNRDLLYTELTAMGYECVNPDGAFYLLLRAPGGDAVAFSERAKTYRILLVPGNDFGCPGYLRLAYCVSPSRVEASLPAFRALISSLS